MRVQKNKEDPKKARMAMWDDQNGKVKINVALSSNTPLFAKLETNKKGKKKGSFRLKCIVEENGEPEDVLVATKAEDFEKTESVLKNLTT